MNQLATSSSEGLAARTPATPPKPGAVLRIGVTGHRVAPKLPEAALARVAEVVGNVLDKIEAAACPVAAENQSVFALRPDGAAACETVVVSSLAEGADQIVAEEAVRRGFTLDAVLPFEADEYAKDFDGAAAERFERLQAKARAVFALDGRREKVHRAYQAAGLLMLANADILIAVWNERAGEEGGTADIVSRAVAEGIPIVLINPADDVISPTVVWAGLEDMPPAAARIEDLTHCDLSALDEVVSAVLSPPAEGETGGTPIRIEEYLRERERIGWRMLPYALFRWVYPTFVSLVRLRLPGRAAFLADPFVAKTEQDWTSCRASGPQTVGPLKEAIDTDLLVAHAFADRLAVRYALRYRGAFVSAYLLAAAASALALVGVFGISPVTKAWLVGIELVLIIAILLLVRTGKSSKWHEKWLAYRRLAELVRPIRVLAYLGASGPLGRPGIGDRPAGFVLWYARAVRRMLPFPSAVVDASYLRKVCAATIDCELAEQLGYNEGTATTMHKVAHRLHTVGWVLFISTGIVGTFYLAVFGWHSHADSLDLFKEHGLAYWTKYLSTFLMALLPTVGAALAAINAHAEFEAIGERSHETAEALGRIRERIEGEAEAMASLALLSDRVERAVDAMQSDLTEWHALSRTRPLALPA
ncbi:hypothetical protein [Acuticoccus sp. I52.16.1]|uniref:hypothetical protein n=1 Tax=Acuticoccus sp. I52.16.1 TaxID=2928472 RepID=UPI001FD20DDE|nr:hypothetical protein [Acuticoccus sp. I52.16.1]UOM36706.1 hypothetical protein MRB58_11155 [Acuticoccus sp. I52.16.1]